jgi:hypothetical protein
VDSATSKQVPAQVRSVDKDATELVVSMGGNDALLRADILDTPVKSSAQALRLLAQAVTEFESNYRDALTACLRKNLPVTVCTIYDGNFPDMDYQARARIALATFNDAIVRVARQKGCPVIELRDIFTVAEDYANPIEPSVLGGAKLALAIKRSIIGA